MKLGLKVLSAGSQEGKVLPVTLTQFLIGRDAQCQLRPNSPSISKRHCAVLVREGKVFVRDFDSTNGTFVNEEQLKGETEVKHGDKLRAGPLEFEILIVKSKPAPTVSDPTPIPDSKKAEAAKKEAPAKKEKSSESEEEDSIADLLLSLGDDDSTSGALSDENVPDGSTIMDMNVSQLDDTVEGEKEQSKFEKEKAKQESTSTAAKAILDKYMKRPR